MAYQMAATAVTLNDLEGHSLVAGPFKYNPSNVQHYTISTDNVLARFVCISRASCNTGGWPAGKKMQLFNLDTTLWQI